MVYESTNGLEYKKEQILLFIKDNEGCTKQAVDNYANKGISSRRTTFKIIDELITEKKIYFKKDKPNSRDYKLYINHGNPIAELSVGINQIKEIFESLIDEIIKDDDVPIQDALNNEHSVRVSIISLISCILKLFISIINEILINYLSKKIPDKDELYKGYNYFHAKISEMHLSFDKLKTILDEKSLDYVAYFAKRNDSSFKTFLWSILIYYETKNNPYKLIFTKNFKSKLFSIMNLIYNLGKRYTPSIYDEIIYDDISFLYLKVEYNPKYYRQLRDELTKLDYVNFIRVLIEQCFFIDSIKNSHIFQMLYEIKSKGKKAHPALWY